MTNISDYHPEDFDVVVQPGVTREALNHFVKDDGLWFPVDPGANASICGMCATGASGTNAVRYGTIKENCLNLEVVLADGRILHTGGKGKRPRKSAAGYNLTNIMVGSEGTLGIITKATIKLHAQPEAIAAAVVNFPDIKSAVDTVVTTLQCSMPMARLELLDEIAVKACNSYSNLTLAEKPTLFLEFHSSEAGLNYQTSTVNDIAKDFGGSDFEFAIQQEDRNKLWTARHKLYYAGINMRAGCRSVTTDACVPVSQLPEMLLKTREDIDAAGLTGKLSFLKYSPNFLSTFPFQQHHCSVMLVMEISTLCSCSIPPNPKSTKHARKFPMQWATEPWSWEEPVLESMALALVRDACLRKWLARSASTLCGILKMLSTPRES